MTKRQQLGLKRYQMRLITNQKKRIFSVNPEIILKSLLNNQTQEVAGKRRNNEKSS